MTQCIYLRHCATGSGWWRCQNEEPCATHKLPPSTRAAGDWTHLYTILDPVHVPQLDGELNWEANL
ncbi:MAG: hypothetical protein AABX89_07415 [Candidatus Thermoplasmatota archaeon]